MTSERIKEIQQQTAYPDSISVQQALLQVWNECSTFSEIEISDKEIQSEAIKRSSKYQDSNLFENTWEEAIEWYKEKFQSIKQPKKD